MIRVLLPFFTSLLVCQASGQLSYAPEAIDIVGTPQDDLITVVVDLTNNSDEDVTWYWKLTKDQSFPGNWETQICDFNLCYGENVDEINPDLPNVLEKQSTRDVKFYLIPNGETGESNLELILYSDKELTQELIRMPSNTVLVSNSTSIVDGIKGDLVLYPNPTTDYFKVSNDKNVRSVGIYNIIGKELRRMKHQSGQSHTIESLAKGMYLVRLFNNTGDVLKSLRLSKR